LLYLKTFFQDQQLILEAEAATTIHFYFFHQPHPKQKQEIKFLSFGGD